ncbi:MAG: transglutaminase-like domain-containing protein [Candidatus Desulfatibia sp.]|uniref:transglutaminase-like domain-containing protein n=1 Tax=Candidatus Desulfatibia sp. TaxID=3101189 RepID=UPI002F2B97AD
MPFTKPLNKTKPFWICAALFGLIFAVLFAVRLDLFKSLSTVPQSVSLSSIDTLPAEDSWMNIFQNGRKIGSSHTTFSKTASGYRFQEKIHMRINTMGLVQDISLNTGGRLNPDFTLSSFDFEISSGRFRFVVEGTISNDLLSIQTQSFESKRKIDIKLKERVYIMPGILKAVAASGLVPGDEFAFQIFDPATMGREAAIVKVIGREEVLNQGINKTATKLSLMFKGVTQLAWIDENGEVLKEKGFLGISLEKTTRDNALFGLPLEASQDLTALASVPSNMLIDDASKLTRLEVEIGGIKYDDIDLHGGRQSFVDNVLTINIESLSDLASFAAKNKSHEDKKEFLKPTPFVQSDHPKIRKLAQKIVSGNEVPLTKAIRLVDWVYKNIDKRPVLSLPDALSTLENRMGDCNEHAVLLAALARATGIPVKIEAGLVYLNGRFYYHAWNLLYLGKWITADALFGQIPVDVTHIRFASGQQKQQLDLMSIIGKIKLKIINQTL